MAELGQRYDQWVNHGLLVFPECPKTYPKQGKAKQHPARNLLERLRDLKDSVLLFLQRFDVPFDNNLAEQTVRPVKVKLKVAGGFRAMGDADAFYVIRSIWETDKLQRPIGLSPSDRSGYKLNSYGDSLLLFKVQTHLIKVRQ